MATASSFQPEVADLQHSEPTAAPAVPTVAKTETNRLQKRFDKLTRRNHELAEAAGNWQARYNAAVQHSNKVVAENAALKADNAKLASALDRALAVGERLQRTRPIIPHPDRYQKGSK